MLRTVAKMIALTCLTLFFLELLLRVGAFFWFGYSQYYLFYGLHNLVGRVGVRPDSTFTGSYYKFPPNYILQGAAGQASETALINSLGFRGPEFQAVKPEGTFRIICLGESSTFGFRNSDTGTYPFQLEKIFQQRQKSKKIEVINAGFPYYNTGSIRSLLEEELFGYSPDLITIYSAFNDVGWPLKMTKFSRISFWLQDNLITYLLIKESIDSDTSLNKFLTKQQKLIQRIARNRFHYDFYAGFEERLDHIAMRYRGNMTTIISSANGKGIPIILIKQPMTTRKRSWYDSVSYEQEYTSTMSYFRERHFLSPIELQIIGHHRLINELEKIGEETNLPIVDNIALVDQNKQRLASWVHLTEEANLRLAEALLEVIEPYVDQNDAP